MYNTHMQIVILAAGGGKRLQPLTFTRSKAMAPVVGRPVVERVIETLLNNSVTELIFVVHPKDTEIQNYFCNQSELIKNARIKLSFVEQRERLGMAHALACAKSLIKETFILSACDSILTKNFVATMLEQHNQHQANATLSLKKVTQDKISKSGIVDISSNFLVRKIVEKPSPEEASSNIASLPMYIFEPNIIDLLDKVPLSSRGEYELQDAIQMLIDGLGGVYGALTDTRLDLTNMNDLLAINMLYLTKIPPALIVNPPCGTSVIPPCFIEGAVGENSRLGPYVYIEKGATVEDGCIVANSIVLDGAVVKAGSEIHNQVYL